MASMSDVVMVCQEAISGIPEQHAKRIVLGILFGMSESGIITEEQEECFRDRLNEYGSVDGALSQMVVLDMEWGD